MADDNIREHFDQVEGRIIQAFEEESEVKD
jgi:hypothetical protein